MNIAEITNFDGFNSAYSLCNVVFDRIRMLLREGHKVHLFTSEKCKTALDWWKMPEISNTMLWVFNHPNLSIHNIIPWTHQTDYHEIKDMSDEHKQIMVRTAQVLTEAMGASKIEVAFTEDLLFQGWSLPHGLGVIEASKKLPGVRFYHAVHSVPSALYSWWNQPAWGENHYITYPNSTDRLRCAEAYKTSIKHVKVLPHIVDVRILKDLSENLWDFIDQFPALLQNEIVCVYPAAIDRSVHKGIDWVISIMAHIKRFYRSVGLLLITQWANDDRYRQQILDLKKFGNQLGLTDDELVFSTDFRTRDGKQFEVGLTRQEVVQLESLANLFIFPTKAESFGLVLPEAALASGALTVLNGSLNMIREVSGNIGLFFPFGSHDTSVQHSNPETFINDVAKIILGRLAENEGLQYRTYARRMFNMDYIYKRYYIPVLYNK